MAVNGISNLRFDGLATGLDTTNIISQLMRAEKIPLDKLFQKKTLLEWKRDNYRDITNTLRAFKDEFMDLLKPATDMRSATPYKKFAVTSSNQTVATATATSGAVKGEHFITQITSLASAAKVSSSSGVSAPLTGTAPAVLDFTSGDNKFVVTLDGVSKSISLRDTFAYIDVDDLVQNGTDGIQDLVNNAFGAGKITVTATPTGEITFSAVNSKITLGNAPTNNALGDLGFASGASNRFKLSTTLNQLIGGGASFTINGNPFNFDGTKTIKDVMTAINSSAAGVQIQYSEVTDKFNITATRLGTGDSIVIEEAGGGLFGAASALYIPSVGDTTSVSNLMVTAGTDAEFTLDGEVIKRSENVVTIDGVTYNLLAKYNAPLDPAIPAIKIAVNQDTQAIYDIIKNFIDKYNALIATINVELLEKYDRKYPPLTDEQKKGMKEEDIKLWEEKAKTGLLRNDSIVQKIVDKMRRAIYDNIDGVGGNITDIGIETSIDYRERGKLTINEAKLKTAIQADPDKVQNLFSKESSIKYSADLSAAERQQRHDETGIVNRLYDIIQDNIRITRDAGGKKGILMEKAGITGDITEFKNLMDKEIGEEEESIAKLQEKLWRKEEYYYRMFSALERSISQMNSQGAWLQQQLGGGN